MLNIESLDHVSLPASDLERSATFYEGVLGLERLARPDFGFDGRWYKVGDRALHLIVPERGGQPTFRHGKPIDSRDVHVAIRVNSYVDAVAHLESKGFRRSPDRNPVPTSENPLPMRLRPSGPAGFPQIYILDPDHNVIEINAAKVIENSER